MSHRNLHLFNAILECDIERVKRYLGSGIDINSKEVYREAIIYAVSGIRQSLDMVKLLIDYGAEIDSATTEGKTILMHASQFGELNIVKYLIEKGANINLKDNNGFTAYDYAKLSGSIEHYKIVNFFKKIYE